MSKKFIFWVYMDDCIIEYIENHYAAQRQSRDHEWYFMYSGHHKELVDGKYNGHVIETENNVTVKGKVLFEELKKRDDYDYLVKIDLDAIIMDIDWLMERVEKHMGSKHAIMGNYAKTRKIGKYIRGPVNATSRSVIDQIDMKVLTHSKGSSKGKRGSWWDYSYKVSYEKAGAEVIAKDLFEGGTRWQGKLPSWHPPKLSIHQERYDIFLTHQRQYMIMNDFIPSLNLSLTQSEKYDLAGKLIRLKESEKWLENNPKEVRKHQDVVSNCDRAIKNLLGDKVFAENNLEEVRRIIDKVGRNDYR